MRNVPVLRLGGGGVPIIEPFLQPPLLADLIRPQPISRDADLADERLIDVKHVAGINAGGKKVTKNLPIHCRPGADGGGVWMLTNYAMYIFGRDDLVKRKGREFYMPRHKGVGEAFYCFSQLGFEKTVLIAPEKSGDFEKPSNFDGIEPFALMLIA